MPKFNKNTFAMLDVTEEEYIDFCERYDKDWHRNKILKQFYIDILEGNIIRDKTQDNKLFYRKHYYQIEKKVGRLDWNEKLKPRRLPRRKKDPWSNKKLF